MREGDRDDRGGGDVDRCGDRASRARGGKGERRRGVAGSRGRTAPAAKSDRVVLRRDGDRAVPFVIGAPEAPRDEGFHTGDALIGATGAFAVTVLASGAVALVRRRRPGRLVERPRAGATA